MVLTSYRGTCYNKARYLELSFMKREKIIKQMVMNDQMILQSVWELRYLKKLSIPSFLANVNVAYEIKRDSERLYSSLSDEQKQEVDQLYKEIKYYLHLYERIYPLFLALQEEENDITIGEYLSTLDDPNKNTFSDDVQFVLEDIARIAYLKKQTAKHVKRSYHGKRQERKLKYEYRQKLKRLKRNLCSDLKEGFTFHVYHNYDRNYYSRSLLAIEKYFLNKASVRQASCILEDKKLQKEIKKISKACTKLDKMMQSTLEKNGKNIGEDLSKENVEYLDHDYREIREKLSSQDIRKLEKKMKNLRATLIYPSILNSKKKKRKRKKNALTQTKHNTILPIVQSIRNNKLYKKSRLLFSRIFVYGADYHYQTCKRIQKNGKHLTKKQISQLQKRLQKTATYKYNGEDKRDIHCITRVSASCMSKKLGNLSSKKADRECNYSLLLDSANQYIKFYQDQGLNYKRGIIYSISTLGLVTCLGIASWLNFGKSLDTPIDRQAKVIDIDNDQDPYLNEDEDKLFTDLVSSAKEDISVEGTKDVSVKETKDISVEGAKDVSVKETEKEIVIPTVVNGHEKTEDNLELENNQESANIKNLSVSPLTYLEKFTLDSDAKVYPNVQAMVEGEAKTPYYDQMAVREAYKIVFLLDGEVYDVLLSNIELCEQYYELGAEVIGYLAINENSKDETGKIDSSLAEGFYRVDDVKRLVK